MDRKYEMIKSGMRGLYRIKALRDFGNVKKGDVGGFVENENSLSHEGLCWVYNNAKIYGYSEIFDNAKISGNAEVFGYSEIFGNAKIYGDARIFGDAEVYDNAEVYGNAKIFGNAEICENARIKEGSHIGKIEEEFKDILYIQCKKRLITVYKDMSNVIKCNIGCQSKMTLEDLLQRIAKDGGMNERREEYVRIMKNAHLLLGQEGEL